MRLSSIFYRAARAANDGEALGEAITTVSPDPIVRRIINKLIGRYIVSRMWWRR